MAEQLLIAPNVPTAASVAVAHEEGTSRVYIVLIDANGQPMAIVKFAPEVALRVSEELNLETGKALVAARGARH